MSSIALITANHLPPPVLGKCCVIATSASSARTDLSADPTISKHVSDGAILTLLADGVDIYIAFSNANAGAVDETANSGASSCFKLVANRPTSFQLAKGYFWLIAKAASGTPKLRVFASGLNDIAQTGT